VGVDRPDCDDCPSAGKPEPELPCSSPPGGGGIRAETRDRATYYAELRAAVAAEYRDVAPREAGNGAWDEAAPGFAGRWAEHERRWPASSREPVDRRADEPGSWRGAGSRFLDASANERVDRGCDRVREIEENVLSPAMRRVEQQDTDRELAGFEYRLKGRERIKEKVAEDLNYKGRSPEAAMSNMKDTVRYTFQYDFSEYSGGVQADITRLKAEGFEAIELRNTWSSNRYKGINSRWREPRSGQLFEVQFHTRASFEAKQLTHGAYERLRSPGTSDQERDELEAFQSRVCDLIPVPLGAKDITDYPRGKA
jgi:hypothetical protein